MKIIHKPHSPILLKINHTPQGGGHPIRLPHPIKDRKFFSGKKKSKRSKK